MASSRRIPSLPGYAELHCRSNFSFLSGASHPEELVARAQALGYAALALTDECSVSGVVRAHAEAERLQMRLIVGAEMQLSRPDAAAAARAGTAQRVRAFDQPLPEPGARRRQQPFPLSRQLSHGSPYHRIDKVPYPT